MWSQSGADFATPRWASTNPRQSQCLFLPFELQAHLPYLVFNFQELAACALYWGGESGSKCVRVSEFQRESDLREGKTGWEGGGRACVSPGPLVTTLLHSQRQRGDRLKSFIQTGMIRQNI